MKPEHCEFTGIYRMVCDHCRKLGYELTEADHAWADNLADHIRETPRLPQRSVAEQYPTQQTWAGVEAAGDRPADLINCEGHDHGDRFLCGECEHDLLRHLTDIPYLLEDLHAALIKDVRFPERGQSHDRDTKDEAPVNFNQAASKATTQICDSLHYETADLRRDADRHPYQQGTRAARWMAEHFADWMRNPDINEIAGEISRAAVHARRVIDRPKDLVYYGVCPKCSGDIRQERVNREDRDAHIVCPRCDYSVPYDEHELACLNAGDDRWLTVDELVGAVESAPGEVVTREQMDRWIKHHGLPRERRERPALLNGEIRVESVDVFRLGDVRRFAADDQLEKTAITSAKAAMILGKKTEQMKLLVNRGKIRTATERSTKPLLFLEEEIWAYKRQVEQEALERRAAG